jgi:tetratricopeptide (TPR) repeat protein
VFNLGSVLLQMGEPETALTYLNRLSSERPRITDAPAYAELAMMLSVAKLPAEAIRFYEQALVGDPNLPVALNNLAWALATEPDERLRNGARAVELAERACQRSKWREPVLMGTLAAAYAEAGRFTDAVTMAERARDLAREQKMNDVAEKNDQLRASYLAGKPHREIP